MTTVAWADGEVTQSELNILKTFYRKFDLSKHELDELKPYLSAPISKKEKDLLYRQMIAELSTPSEKKEIVVALENMAQAHKRIKKNERPLVDQFSDETLRRLPRFKKFDQMTFGNINKDRFFDLFAWSRKSSRLWLNQFD